MKNILQQIKWAYQRVVRNYDDRVFWGFSTEFNTYIKPIKEHCDRQLSETHIELNLERKAILIKTLDLLKDLELDKENAAPKLWEYFGKHIEWFWD